MVQIKFKADSGPLLRQLKLFNDAKQKAFLRTAARKGARIYRKAMRNAAPRGTGLLRRSLDIVIRTYKASVVAIVSPKSRYKVGKKYPAQYAIFIQRGFKNKSPNDFVARAYRNSADEALEVMKNSIKESIVKELNK